MGSVSTVDADMSPAIERCADILHRRRQLMGYPCRRACRSRLSGAKWREPRIVPTMPLRGGTGLDDAPAGGASRELQVPVGPAGCAWIPHPAPYAASLA